MRNIPQITELGIPSSFRPIISTPIQIIKPPPYQFLQTQPLQQTDNSNSPLNQMLQDIYKKYLNLFQEQNNLDQKLNQTEKQNKSLRIHFSQLKKDFPKSAFKIKRLRRNANEIARNFKCPSEQCDKTYGSEGSLLQHVKLKHILDFQKRKYDHIFYSKSKNMHNENVMN